MHTTIFRPRAIAIAVLFASASVAAHAGIVYGDVTTPPGIYFGNGNPNGNFQINRDVAGLELAIRAKNRIGAPVLIDGSTGTYAAAPGTIAPGNVRATWNYEFSILSGNGIDAYLYRLGVDTDNTPGINYFFVDPVTYWTDNSKYFDAGGQLDGIQASQNVGFGDTPGGAHVGNGPGNFSFVLAAFARGTTNFSLANALAVTSMNVDVPEPASIALVGAALLGLALSRRRVS